jgi:hypothetical protein
MDLVPRSRMYQMLPSSHISLHGTWCDYEVPGIILLQSYLYAYSLLREVALEILPLIRNALSPTMLPLLEAFLELLLGNVFQCHHVYLDVFNILKSSSL